MSTPLHATQVGAPHYLAYLANHFFYLLSEGAVVPTGFGPGTAANLTPEALVANGDTALVGIGNTKAFGIWHHALTAHFSATISFVQAGTAFSAAACELYGAESPEHRAVIAAWKAISSGAFVNSSSRASDGGEIDPTAAIGIPTARLHAFGPKG